MPTRRAASPHLLSESLKKDKLAAGAKIDYATWVAARKLGEAGRARVDALFSRLRRHPDRAGAGRGAARPVDDRQGHVQSHVDLSLDAVRDLALHQGTNWPAGRHPARRPPARGLGACWISPPGCGGRCHEAARRRRSGQGDRSRHAHLGDAGARLPRAHRRARAGGEGVGVSRSRRWRSRRPRRPMRRKAACCAACRSGSRTSSTRTTCRPATTRRSSRARCRSAMLPASRSAGPPTR